MSGAERHLVYEFGGFRLDPRRRLLSHSDGTPIVVTAKAFDTLVYLVEHAGELLPRSEMLDAIWPRTIVEDGNLNQTIWALRRVLGDDHGGQRYIVTVPGRGYQFVADVQTVPVPARTDTENVAPVTTAEHLRWPRSPMTALVTGAVIGVSLIGVFSVSRQPDRTSQALATMARVSPVTTYPGDELSPSLSPDGRQVAFSWDGADGNRDIYVTQIGGPIPLRLTEDSAVDRDPSWSPDGARIAFLRQHAPRRLDVLVVPALGGPERKLQSVRMNFISREGAPLLAWTPDSRRIVFTTQPEGQEDSASYHLHVLSLDSGELRPLSLADRVYDTSPAISPDARWLAFTRFEISMRLNTLMLQELGPGVTPAGEPRPIPGVPPGIFHSLSWSPDGKHLAFVNGAEILEWDVGGGVRSVYTATAGWEGLSLVRREGTARAVAAEVLNDADIWVLPLDPLARVALGPPTRRVMSTASDRHPRFSPDGSQLAFVSGRSGKPAVWVADAGGESPRQVTDLDAVISGFPRFSPDGRQIAFHVSVPNQERQVYLVDVDSGSPRQFIAGAVPTWSADGQYLYVTEVADVSTIARIRVADRQRERLFTGDMAIESSDGRYLLYSKVREPGIFRRPRDAPLDALEERLVDDYTPTLGGIVPVDDGVFYLGHTPAGIPRAFRFYDYAKRAAHDVAAAPSSIGLGLTVSPDGRELLYSANGNESGSDLVLFEFGRASDEFDKGGRLATPD
ncbi:MAG TPA: winged helix-turn-helix domain-containing protein [Woeseiaceae bacterium]|nr:winged helix-turn-helix domain-containing protein [Woeseiaceae bacterium]